MKRGLVLIACLISLACGDAIASSPRERLDRAGEALDDADRIAPTDEAAARALRQEAIALYRGLLDDGYGENARVYRNLGTAYMRAGDVGRAVVALRRADRLAPTDPLVKETLASARAAVRTRVEPNRSAVDTLLWWRGRVSRSVLAGVGAAAWVCLWGALVLKLVIRRGRYGAVAFACGVVTFISLGSLAFERWLLAADSSVVVVADGVVARKGPSVDAYEPAFEQPIRAGVEAELLERRGEWVRIRLPSGQQSWLPAEAIEAV